jgi:Resolvase, N terminal domain
VRVGRYSTSPGKHLAGYAAEPQERVLVRRDQRRGPLAVQDAGWLARPGRSLRSLIAFVEELRQRGVGFKSLCDTIDTGTPAGRFFFHLLAALAEMERDLIRERTQAGLSAARARGRKGGRKPKLTAQQIEKTRHLLEDRMVTVTEVAAKLKVNRSTICRALGIAGQGEFYRASFGNSPRVVAAGR